MFAKLKEVLGRLAGGAGEEPAAEPVEYKSTSTSIRRASMPKIAALRVLNKGMQSLLRT